MAKYNSKEEQLAALREKFPVSEIKILPKGGKEMLYYPVELIRERLNTVFGADYEFRIGQIFHEPKFVDLTGILTVRWVDGSSTTVEEVGCADVEYAKSDPSKRASEALKSAASDVIKRCMAFLGCGAELYDPEYRESVQGSVSSGGGNAGPSRPAPSRPAPATASRPAPARK